MQSIYIFFRHTFSFTHLLGPHSHLTFCYLMQDLCNSARDPKSYWNNDKTHHTHSGGIHFSMSPKRGVVLPHDKSQCTNLATQKEQELLLGDKLAPCAFLRFIERQPTALNFGAFENERHPHTRSAFAVWIGITGRIAAILPEMTKCQMWTGP